jgi:hypothetical protein
MHQPVMFGPTCTWRQLTSGRIYSRGYLSITQDQMLGSNGQTANQTFVKQLLTTLPSPRICLMSPLKYDTMIVWPSAEICLRVPLVNTISWDPSGKVRSTYQHKINSVRRRYCWNRGDIHVCTLLLDKMLHYFASWARTGICDNSAMENIVFYYLANQQQIYDC